MSAVLRPTMPVLQPMTAQDLDDVTALEQTVYGFPWSRGNFSDSLASGYHARVLRDDAGALCGYIVAQPGVAESHLLNVTVAPQLQGRGLGLVMLDDLVARGRHRGDHALWLEVRLSNTRARAVYARYGFAEVGLRRGYYPAAASRREDAAVLRLTLATAPTNAHHALD
jgi:[ribosomal protein S18]-alanine N-acetyltransferase